MKENVEKIAEALKNLTEKARQADKADEAMKYMQAVLNGANAIRYLNDIQIKI